MKLQKTKKYNESYPSFNLRAMDARQEGVPLGQSVTIKLVDSSYVWENKDNNTKSALSGPLLIKTIPYNGKTFDVNNLTGTLVSGNVDNIATSGRDTTTFNITSGVAKKILESYSTVELDTTYTTKCVEELANKTLKFTLVEDSVDIPKKDKDGNIETDDDGKWVMEHKEFMTFDVSEVLDDGSEKKLGGNSSSSSACTPEAKSTIPIPKAILEVNGAPTVELSDVEKAIFKEVRTNEQFNNKSDENSWINYAKKSVDEFKTMMTTISTFLSLTYVVDESRIEGLFNKYCEV